MTKQKLKIKKSVARRFQVTKTGKVMYKSAFNRHIKRTKSKKQLRRLKKPKVMHGRWATKIKKLLGYI